jgi:hypothetical protein
MARPVLRTKKVPQKKIVEETSTSKSITSSATGLTPLVDIQFVIEQTVSSLKSASKEDYFKNNELQLGKIFKIQPRTSGSDTRPDLPLTSSQIDQLLGVNYNYEKISSGNYAPDDKKAASIIQKLRSSLSEFENQYQSLGAGATGVEVKGSQAGYDDGQDFNVRPSLRKIGIEVEEGAISFTDKKKNLIPLIETSLQGFRENVLKVVAAYANRPSLPKDQLYLFNVTKERTTPRSLSSRTLLTGYDAAQFDPNSMVISLSKAIIDNITGITRLTEKQYLASNRKESEKQLGENIYNFFKQNDLLTPFHKAITGLETGLRKNDSLNKQLKNLAETPAAKQIQAKGKLLFMQYVTGVGNNKQIFTAFLKDTFKYENTSITLTPTSIKFAYTDRYETAVVDRIKEALNPVLSNTFNKNVVEIIKDTDLEGYLNNAQNLKELSGEAVAEVKADTSGSLPIGKIKIPSYTVKRKSTGSAFQSRIGSIRSILSETRAATRVKPSIGDFITDDTITALTKREMLRRMPIGPVGGPPKSSRVLTYRTGRFVNSLQVMADMKSATMQYYYNPNYWVHEATSRNPRNLIGSSLSSVTRALFGKRFNLIKANQGLD